MECNWEAINRALKKIDIQSNPNNEPVTVHGFDEELHCIGIGTDAAVFRHEQAQNYALKLFAKGNQKKMKMEEQVYKQLGDSPFFPKYYGSGPNYLILSYEQGVTLYDCLLKGIHIPKQVIQDVEEARAYARTKGLNPRDIHLKNILLHDGRAKLLDVSEYMMPGDDHRWDYLKKGYEEYYHFIDRKPIPLWMLETVRKWFNQTNRSSFDFNEFVHKLMKLYK